QHCPIAVRDAFEVGARHRIEGLGRVVDRVLRLLPSRGIGIEASELIDEMVESRPKVVERIAREQAEAQGWLAENADPERVLPGVEVVIDDGYVGVRVDKELGFGFGLFQVLHRAPELRESAIERMSHGGSMRYR